MSFTVKARSGITLNQLRLMSGVARLSDTELIELSGPDPIVYPGASSEPGDRAVVSDGLFLASASAGPSFVGYRAGGAAASGTRPGQERLRGGRLLGPCRAEGRKLILGAGEFYLLVSRERVGCHDYAAEMAAYDPTSGELGRPYAGFFDPGFGDVQVTRQGTPAVLEVRAPRCPVLARARSATVQAHLRADVHPAATSCTARALGSSYQRSTWPSSRQFRADQAGRSWPRLRKRRPGPAPLVQEAGAAAP